MVEGERGGWAGRPVASGARKETAVAAMAAVVPVDAVVAATAPAMTAVTAVKQVGLAEQAATVRQTLVRSLQSGLSEVKSRLHCRAA